MMPACYLHNPSINHRPGKCAEQKSYQLLSQEQSAHAITENRDEHMFHQ